jgi:hypothetical protein
VGIADEYGGKTTLLNEVNCFLAMGADPTRQYAVETDDGRRIEVSALDLAEYCRDEAFYQLIENHPQTQRILEQNAGKANTIRR